MTKAQTAEIIDLQTYDADALDAKVHEMRTRLATIFENKGMHKGLSSEFYSLIGNYVSDFSYKARHNDPYPYREFVQNMDSVMHKLEKMNKEKSLKFEEALTSWIHVIRARYFKELTINPEAYQSAVFIMFNKLFLQLGTKEYRKKAQLAMASRELAYTLSQNEQPITNSQQ